MSDYNVCIQWKYCKECAKSIGPNYEVSDHLNGECNFCKIRNKREGAFHLADESFWNKIKKQIKKLYGS